MPLAPSADAEVPLHCPQEDWLTFYPCQLAEWFFGREDMNSLPELKLKFLGKSFKRKDISIYNVQNMWKKLHINLTGELRES